jgi:anti-sigma-K factor RskA
VTCAEFRELAAAYALGALDPDEQKAAEQHLAAADHEGCREALERARAAADALGDSVAPVRPPASVWQGIQDRLGDEGVPAARRPPTRTAWVVASLAAVAAAFAVVAAVRFHLRGKDLEQKSRLAVTKVLDDKQVVTTERDQCRKDLAAARADNEVRLAALALLELPTTRLVDLQPQGSRPERGRAMVNFDVGQGYILGSGLVPVEGKTYELWVVRGGHAYAAGIFDGDASGRVTFPIDPELIEAGAEAFAISLEPGRVMNPERRGEIVLVGAIPKT